MNSNITKWAEIIKTRFPELIVIQEVLEPYRFSTYGDRVSITVRPHSLVSYVSSFSMNFVLEDFHGGCGVGIIFKYSLRLEKYTASDVSWMMEELFKIESHVRGAFLAVNPLVEGQHFLRIVGFVPLIKWGNPIHRYTPLAVWIKRLRSTNGGSPFIVPDTPTDLDSFKQAKIEELEQEVKVLKEKLKNVESEKTTSKSKKI